MTKKNICEEWQLLSPPLWSPFVLPLLMILLLSPLALVSRLTSMMPRHKDAL
jgi:hypothetical protein